MTSRVNDLCSIRRFCHLSSGRLNFRIRRSTRVCTRTRFLHLASSVARHSPKRKSLVFWIWRRSRLRLPLPPPKLPPRLKKARARRNGRRPLAMGRKRQRRSQLPVPSPACTSTSRRSSASPKARDVATSSSSSAGNSDPSRFELKKAPVKPTAAIATRIQDSQVCSCSFVRPLAGRTW